MKQFVISFAICFLVSFLASGAIAGVLITPMLGEGLGDYLRSPEQAEGSMAALGMGFLLLCLAMTWLYLRISPQGNWLKSGFLFGLAMWLFVTGDYLIVVGWSTIPPTPMILSGLLSGLGPLLGALAMAFYNRKRVS